MLLLVYKLINKKENDMTKCVIGVIDENDKVYDYSLLYIESYLYHSDLEYTARLEEARVFATKKEANAFIDELIQDKPYLNKNELILLEPDCTEISRTSTDDIMCNLNFPTI